MGVHWLVGGGGDGGRLIGVHWFVGGGGGALRTKVGDIVLEDILRFDAGRFGEVVWFVVG